MLAVFNVPLVKKKRQPSRLHHTHTHTASNLLLSSDDLLGDGLMGFQGPALLAFNDAIFTERDFESISRVGDSKKRGVAGKTGRFG